MDGSSLRPITQRRSVQATCSQSDTFQRRQIRKDMEKHENTIRTRPVQLVTTAFSAKLFLFFYFNCRIPRTLLALSTGGTALRWRNVIDSVIARRRRIKKIGITKNAKTVCARGNAHSETRQNVIHIMGEDGGRRQRGILSHSGKRVGA